MSQENPAALVPQKREHWASHLGFILASAGSAVGLGNIWRFPYITGENGGGAFVLVYLACVCVVGIPVMVCEFAMGRKTEKDPVGAFSALSGGSPLWKSVGFMGVIAAFVILSYYSVVAGWTLAYILKAAAGQFAQFADPDSAWRNFLAFAAHPFWPIAFHGLFVALCIWIVHSGVRDGIENWCDKLMPALFLILAVIIVRSLTLPGAGKGVSFFLQPDFAKLTPQAFLIALGHAFFSLSVGMGAMITYGSYVDKSENLWKSTLIVAGLDTGTAFLAGLAIFPAVFAMGFDPAAGPGLVFKVLPAVFSKMPGGSVLWGSLFFILLAIAALTSGVSLLEVVTAYFVDEKGAPRHKVTLWSGLIIFLVGIPCALSFGMLGGFTVFGRTVFDNLDYLASNMLLPVGGFLICVFVGWKWGIRAAFDEIAVGSHEFEDSLHQKTLKVLIRYVTPVCVLLVLLFSIGILKF